MVYFRIAYYSGSEALIDPHKFTEFLRMMPAHVWQDWSIRAGSRWKR